MSFVVGYGKPLLKTEQASENDLVWYAVDRVIPGVSREGRVLDL